MMRTRTYQMDGEPTAGGGTQQQRDLAGYPDENALVQGYRASSQEAQRQKARADQAEAALQQMQVAANQRPDIVQRPVDPYQQLNDYGVPADALRQAIAAEIQQAFTPIQQGLQARSQVLAEYPDFQKFEAEVARFIESDPALQNRYQRMMQAAPDAAIEYAFLKFGENRRRTQPATPPNGVSPDAAAQAQIPTTRSGDSRGTDPGYAQHLAAAYEHYQKTGQAEPLVKARLRSVISDDFLNQGH